MSFNSFPSDLLWKIQDLSEYLNHMNTTIDIKVGNHKYFFSVDQSFETKRIIPHYNYHKRKLPSDLRRNKLRKARFLEKEYLAQIFPTNPSDEHQPAVDDNILLNYTFISDSPLPENENHTIEVVTEMNSNDQSEEPIFPDENKEEMLLADYEEMECEITNEVSSSDKPSEANKPLENKEIASDDKPSKFKEAASVENPT